MNAEITISYDCFGADFIDELHGKRDIRDKVGIKDQMIAIFLGWADPMELP